MLCNLHIHKKLQLSCRNYNRVCHCCSVLEAHRLSAGVVMVVDHDAKAKYQLMGLPHKQKRCEFVHSPEFKSTKNE